MKRFAVLSLMTMCLILNLLAQKPEKKSISPKENSTVKKEYDEKGNLIQFDSTYTYSWSNDTTMLNSMSPEDISKMFSDHFGFKPDSSTLGNSFFKGFSQFFDKQFDDKNDSLLIQKFGKKQFHEFRFDGDSLAMNFPDFDQFFFNFGKSQHDSISPDGEFPQLKSMDEMMNMIQKQMEEFQKNLQKDHSIQKKL